MRRAPKVNCSARIRVVGVGRAGTQAVNLMIAKGVRGVAFITLNNNPQMQLRSAAHIQLTLAGAGSKPPAAKWPARRDLAALHSALAGSDMVLVTAAMGDELSAGVAPLVAEVARRRGSLVVGVVTRPFPAAGQERDATAEQGILQLREQVDTLILIGNDQLLAPRQERPSSGTRLALADNLLGQGIQGITELVTIPGLINLDYADVRAIMAGGGTALMTTGKGYGRDKALVAASQALASNLTGQTIDGARRVILNVTGGHNLTLHEVDCVASLIRTRVDSEAQIIFGAVVNDKLVDELHVTVIATDFAGETAVVTPLPPISPPTHTFWQQLSSYTRAAWPPKALLRKN